MLSNSGEKDLAFIQRTKGGADEMAVPPSPEKGSMVRVNRSVYAPSKFQFAKNEFVSGRPASESENLSKYYTQVASRLFTPNSTKLGSKKNINLPFRRRFTNTDWRTRVSTR
jgi:hypothetical protein